MFVEVLCEIAESFGPMTKLSTMKSKQTSASTTNGRPIFNVKPYYSPDGTVHPQWMRSLEDKYQRIHTKIAQSTTAMSNLYRSTLGRTIIQDKPNLRAISQSKEYASVPRLNSLTHVNYKKSFSSRDPRVQRVTARGNISATKISAAANTLTTVAPVEKKPTVAPQNSLATHSFENDSVISEHEEDNDIDHEEYNDIDDEEELIEIIDDDDEKVNDFDNVERMEVNTNNRQCEIELLKSEYGDDYINEDTADNVKENDEPKDELKDVNKHFNQLKTDVNETGNIHLSSADKETKFEQIHKSQVQKTFNRGPFITQLGGHYQHERLTRRDKVPRTSTSRRSIQTLKTVKSCPAAMDNHNRPTSMLVQPTEDRSKSAHKLLKKPGGRNTHLFSRMSMEAQHALTETKNQVKPGVGFIDVNNAMKQLSRENTPNVSIQDHSKNITTQAVSVHNQVHRIGTCAPENEAILCDVELPKQAMNAMVRLQGSHSSCSQGVDRDVFNSNTKLPNIGDNVYNLNNMHTQRNSFPGIGQFPNYQKREPTFEITPPGFDVRYKEVRMFDERESETPPPDIKERAVQKCTEWLARYTPR